MSDIVILDGVTEVSPDVVSSAVTRAMEVREKLGKIKDNMEGSFIDLCYLLYEAATGKYHEIYGFKEWGAWVKEGSGLEISERQAFYYLNIARSAHKLNISKDELRKIRVTKLREIFGGLDAEKNEAQIRALLAAAETDSLETVKEKVAAIKNPAPGGGPAQQFMTLKLDSDVKALALEAIELARKNYGDTVANGEVKDISVSKAMELIFQCYLQDVNNYPEGASPTAQAPAVLQ